MGNTNYFSLKKFGSEGRLSDDNYKFSDRDRSTIDSLLWTLVNHDHREVADGGSLAGPTEPVLTVDTVGGTLAAGTSYYYKLSFMDSSGSETGASSAIIADTADLVPSPPIQTLSSVSTGGALNSGIYRYALSYYQTAGGETRAVNVSTILVPTGTSTNVITVGLLTAPEDADGWKVYRKSPDDSDYHFLYSVVKTGTPPTSWDDDGSETIDCTKIRPSSNTTNSTSVITVDLNAADIPLDERIVSWKIYRSAVAGVFGSSSLLATVVETTTEGGSDLITTYDDLGSTSTVAGAPLTQSVVPPPIPQLDASAIFASSGGRLPSGMAPAGVNTFNMLCPGTIALQDYNQFYLPHDMPLERVDLFFLDAPTGVDGSNYVVVRFSDDSTADEEQELYNNAATINEVQSLYNNATAGDFTLSDGTDTTDPIDFDATAGVIATRLETDIAAFTDIQVTGMGTPSQPWYIEFIDPGAVDVDPLTVDDAGLTGGTSTLTEETAGSDGGTFTLSDGTDTTNTMVYGVSAAVMETRLETDIASITAVTVTGTGISSDPWVIAWVTPSATNVNMLIVDDSSLEGTSFISESVAGHGVTQVDAIATTETQYHYWQSTTTDYGEQEAETSPATGGVLVSDAFATNDVAMELDTVSETNEWTVGSGLDVGDYVARFYVSGMNDTGTYVIRVIDTVGPTTMASLTVSDGSLYIPAHELLFTDTGAETWKFEVEKTAGTGDIRVDRYEYEAVLPVLHAGGTATVEVLEVGSPTTHGVDIQVTAWY